MAIDTFVANGHARRAGRVENYFCILKRRQIYKSFCLIARFNKHFSDDEIARALRAMILKYPMLAISVVTTDYWSDLTKPHPTHDYIKVLDSLTLDQVLVTIPDEIKNMPREEQLAALNNYDWKYESEAPTFKIGRLDDNTVVYISNHICSDGVSGKNFFHELQRYLNTTSSDPVPEYLINYEQDHSVLPKLPPPIDEMIDYNIPWHAIAPYFFNLTVIKTMCFSSIISSRSDTHTYKIINIPSSTLTTLRSSLKAEGVTLSPYFNSAWMQAFNTTFLSSSWLKLTDFSVPCDSRQYLECDTDAFKFGANTGGNHFYHHPVTTHNWASIKYFNDFFKWSKLKRNFLFGLGFITSPTIEKRANLDKIIDESHVGVKRTGTVMSNIGALHDVSGEYQIEDVLFAKNSGGTQFSFSLAIVTTKQGGLNCVVSMVDGVAPEAQFEKLIQKFEKNILELAN